ncbi:MAG TPA: hypothetical protein VFE53_14875 [Mucilaginibacter sp.]|nr:hypothetical protein [Mucilaginibacter sp.]
MKLKIIPALLCFSWQAQLFTPSRKRKTLCFALWAAGNRKLFLRLTVIMSLVRQLVATSRLTRTEALLFNLQRGSR